MPRLKETREQRVKRYEQYLRGLYAWSYLKQCAMNESEGEPDENNTVRAYMGTVQDIFPSGKYYTAFACSNVNEAEIQDDADFMQAFQNVATDYNGYIIFGEDDPCDLFILFDYEDCK